MKLEAGPRRTWGLRSPRSREDLVDRWTAITSLIVATSIAIVAICLAAAATIGLWVVFWIVRDRGM